MLTEDETKATPFGDVTKAELRQVNDPSRGKCWLWVPKFKARKHYPSLLFWVNTPPNE